MRMQQLGLDYALDAHKSQSRHGIEVNPLLLVLFLLQATYSPGILPVEDVQRTSPSLIPRLWIVARWNCALGPYAAPSTGQGAGRGSWMGFMTGFTCAIRYLESHVGKPSFIATSLPHHGPAPWPASSSCSCHSIRLGGPSLAGRPRT